ncbi:unnamed protein product [Anisakis simplex]|uniref:Transposase n=1 Tax=Anisakis simplex TaxID=6269 RepID=A0A0M3KID0_ANISI|nr:unnamed protein product [Anisakis simplex]
MLRLQRFPEGQQFKQSLQKQSLHPLQKQPLHPLRKVNLKRCQKCDLKDRKRIRKLLQQQLP